MSGLCIYDRLMLNSVLPHWTCISLSLKGMRCGYLMSRSVPNLECWSCNMTLLFSISNFNNEWHLDTLISATLTSASWPLPYNNIDNFLGYYNFERMPITEFNNLECLSTWHAHYLKYHVVTISRSIQLKYLYFLIVISHKIYKLISVTKL
jgi:hypothetical protein